MFRCLYQWFSTGVPRQSWVPKKALGVPPNSEIYDQLMVNCTWGRCQIVLQPRQGAANQKRLRNTALYRLHQGFRLNLGKISKMFPYFCINLISTTFNVSNNVWSSSVITAISRTQNTIAKLSLPKSLMHTVDIYISFFIFLCVFLSLEMPMPLFPPAPFAKLLKGDLSRWISQIARVQLVFENSIFHISIRKLSRKMLFSWVTWARLFTALSDLIIQSNCVIAITVITKSRLQQTSVYPRISPK